MTPPAYLIGLSNPQTISRRKRLFAKRIKCTTPNRHDSSWDLEVFSENFCWLYASVVRIHSCQSLSPEPFFKCLSHLAGNWAFYSIRVGRRRIRLPGFPLDQTHLLPRPAYHESPCFEIVLASRQTLPQTVLV
jgi:hypothetical protein